MLFKYGVVAMCIWVRPSLVILVAQINKKKFKALKAKELKWGCKMARFLMYICGILNLKNLG